VVSIRFHPRAYKLLLLLIDSIDLVAANDFDINISCKYHQVTHYQSSLSDSYVTPSISQAIMSSQLLMREKHSFFLIHLILMTSCIKY
jgi:hypothetical protein